MAKKARYLYKNRINGAGIRMNSTGYLFFLFSKKQLALIRKIYTNEYKKNLFLATYHCSPFINFCAADYAVP